MLASDPYKIAGAATQEESLWSMIKTAGRDTAGRNST